MNSAYDTDNDRYLPDPDAVDIRIGCDRDNEAEAAITTTVDSTTLCPTCSGSGTFGFDRNGSHSAGEYCEYECPTCHGTGVK